ncbi:hypothetical protein [Companilactobacillus alimentarius]|uniref:hypothetical protein n=1 Tax=Companilactobacillus alimentarius TaxID=1602 RepID=UPI0028B50A67|nr:hypothetical protein [Companilactobacillus alimentarius]MDT6951862.1 hypothetical protein [Companilactobacillus alimentarius]
MNETKVTVEIEKLISDLEMKKLRIKDILNIGNDSISNQQKINGLMNDALRVSANQTGYKYEDIIKLWINSMFPDMGVKFMSVSKKAISRGDEITLLNCGRYQSCELVSKYGTKLDLPDNYTVIVLKNN